MKRIHKYCLNFSALFAVLQVAIDTATPLDEAGTSGNFMMNNVEPYGGYGGPMRPYGRMYGSLDFDDVSISYMNSIICSPDGFHTYERSLSMHRRLSSNRVSTELLIVVVVYSIIALYCL